MKKYALVALFAVAVFGMAFAATTQSGPASISGLAAEVFSLTVPGTYMGTIANGSTAETWNLGIITVNSNVRNWQLSVSSANSGYLVNTADNTEKIAYTITVAYLDITDWSLSRVAVSPPQPRTSKTGNIYPVQLKFGPSADYYQAGTYGDTLTVTISHN
ncbi:exported hypothetical protein [uncultured spirochete]|jgi:hypothetical protein|uniref:Spore coat protein U domain-containing protein n=1 Tax=uncultured spirochete TaxID=156406 RepID=A0A3P3XM21_9SPIR|nr:hypothetical protein [Rectinema subterraneum]SLM15961.1 exported hypothetical protein [uncultured spirochete]